MEFDQLAIYYSQHLAPSLEGAPKDPNVLPIVCGVVAFGLLLMLTVAYGPKPDE